jgi:hypothetical protein
MAVVKRIGPGSAFKVGFVVYAVLGLVVGVLCALAALAGAPFALYGHMPFAGAFVGVFAVSLCPILYGTLGGIITVISALIYNLASGWVG